MGFWPIKAGVQLSEQASGIFVVVGDWHDLLI